MNEKLKNELEKVSYSPVNVLPFLVIIAVIVALSIFFFVVPPSPETPKESQNNVRQVPPKPQIYHEDFVVPANGSVNITRRGYCNTSNIPNGTKVTRQDLQNKVIYTSTEKEPIFARIWFYDREDSASCRDRLDVLVKQGVLK